MGSVFERKDTGSIVIKFKDPNGKWVHKTIGRKGIVTKTMAREILKEYERKVKKNEYDMVDAEIPTLREFEHEYIDYVRDIKKNRSWMSTVNHLKQLKRLFANTELTRITPSDIDDYKQKRLKEVKPSTVNRELACLSHLLNYAKRKKKFFGENPVSISRLLPEHNQTERILTYEEERKLLEVSPIHFRNILKCALNTGMRKGEIISLKWTNVDLEKNIINLEHTNTKSKKSRRIPINSVLRKLFLELKLKNSGSEYVFLNSDNKPYKKHDSLNGIWKRVLNKAEIEGLRFHDLRHTAATRMVEAGISIVAVNKILGHADLKTTMRYAHPDNSLVDAVESLTKVNFSNSNGNGFGNVQES